jgi:hypothetical protein
MTSVEQMARRVLRHHGKDALLELVMQSEPFVMEEARRIFAAAGTSKEMANLLAGAVRIGICALMSELDPSCKLPMEGM